MQAVVKTPRIEISVRGAAIPPRLMDVLKELKKEKKGQKKGVRPLYNLLSLPRRLQQ